MKKQSFLVKLKREGKLELVEPSEEICKSYLEKANNCFKSAKLLLQNNLYENSISMSYYAMYNPLIALLFKIGIKCENHPASIILFKRLFNRIDLFKTISFAKEERVDKQYYIASKQDVLTKRSAQEMYTKAENFIIKMKLLINNLNIEEIEKIRNRFVSIF